MYGTTVEMVAKYHQEDLLREARNARLAREATGDHHTSAQHRVVAVAVLVLLALAVVVLI
jgi:hypothetical protein